MILKKLKIILIAPLILIAINCPANEQLHPNQALVDINNQLATLETQRAQINQQYDFCLRSIQTPQMPCYGDDFNCILAEGNFLSAQTAQMASCGQVASSQLNQIESARNNLLYQRSLLEQQIRIDAQANTNNNLPPVTALPPVSPNTAPSGTDNMNSLNRQRADQAHQRQLDLIREQGEFNLRKDCNNSDGTWWGRPTGCIK